MKIYKARKYEAGAATKGEEKYYTTRKAAERQVAEWKKVYGPMRDYAVEEIEVEEGE